MEFKPKKSLGQNFLIDQNILDVIIQCSQIKENQRILEIGPGTGNLTNKLILSRPKELILIEKDKQLSKLLIDKFKNNIKLYNRDVLKTDFENIVKNKMIFFGNLPYNVSSQILVKFIKNEKLNSICKKMVLMFQKEVAQRILAQTNEKHYGRLSIMCSWRLKMRKIKDVKPGSFYPPPKINSTILLFEPKIEYFSFKNSKNLEKITSTFFSQKRKMIKTPLKHLFLDYKKIANKFDLDLSLRPQNLTPNTYFKICREYEKLN